MELPAKDLPLASVVDGGNLERASRLCSCSSSWLDSKGSGDVDAVRRNSVAACEPLSKSREDSSSCASMSTGLVSPPLNDASMMAASASLTDASITAAFRLARTFLAVLDESVRVRIATIAAQTQPVVVVEESPACASQHVDHQSAILQSNCTAVGCSSSLTDKAVEPGATAHSPAAARLAVLFSGGVDSTVLAALAGQ